MLEHISWRSYKNQPVGFWVNAVTGREIEFTFLMERDGCTRHVNSHVGRWTHHWPYYIFEAQFFFRVLPNTWISMELTNDHFITFFLSNEVKKLTARFQISNWICKIHGHLFLQYQKKWCTSILLIIFFNQIYSSLFFQCCKLNFPRWNTPIRKSTPKEKNCKIHTALIDRSFIRKRGDIWAEKSVWWTNEWTF